MIGCIFVGYGPVIQVLTFSYGMALVTNLANYVESVKIVLVSILKIYLSGINNRLMMCLNNNSI